ncbi:OmpA family protein [Oceanidesulfovibrio marinus]|nr:OmpA family protein [Oceanidesulfovibrio marinus]
MAKTEPALDADGIGAGTAKAPHQTQEPTADPQTPAALETIAPEPAQQSVAAKDVQSAPLAIEEVQPSPPAIEADWPVIDPVASVEGEEKSAAASPADQERQPVKRAATLDAGAQEVAQDVGQEVTQSAGAKEGTTEVTRPMVASVEARSPTESGGSPPGLFPQDPSEYMDARKHDSEDAAASASQTIEETAALPGESGAGAETAASLTGDGDSASDVIEEQGVPQETGGQARTLLARVSAGRMFVKGHDTLPPDSLRRIEELAATVRLSPGERLLVVGHTDDVPLGPELRRLYGTNFGLSLTRARQVRNLLVAGGVAPEAVGVAGVGNLHPLVPNTTTENREQNRRVDIWIVQKNRQQARQ